MADEPDAMATPPKTSDLKVRVMSAIVMIAAAFGLFWVGGIAFLIGVIILGGLVFLEFGQLVDKFASTPVKRLLWKGFGLIYVSAAVWAVWDLRERQGDGVDGLVRALTIVALVAAVDVFAYFTGRALGGPKIWPAISPSKTWSGFLGGIIGASLVFEIAFITSGEGEFEIEMVPFFILIGTLVTFLAQSGDFFESWMKRRAGVKDSGKLIPGHGGIFDRVDGLLPVLIAAALVLGFLRSAGAG